MILALTALAGGLGGMAQFLVDTAVNRHNRWSPLGTVVVNATACLFLGLPTGYALGHPTRDEIYAVLDIGLLRGNSTTTPRGTLACCARPQRRDAHRQCCDRRPRARNRRCPSVVPLITNRHRCSQQPPSASQTGLQVLDARRDVGEHRDRRSRVGSVAGVVGRISPRPCIDAHQRQNDQQACPSDEGDVGHVTHEESVVVDEVHHVASREAGRAEYAVAEMTDRSPEEYCHAERQKGLNTRVAKMQSPTTAAAAITVRIHVNCPPIPNAAPGL